MLAEYMKAMSLVVEGTEPLALARLGMAGLDPHYARVYRNNSVCALCEVLEANYPSVVALVGADYFLKLVHLYIQKYPARQRTLVGYGEAFHQIVNGLKADHRLPWLGEFARLDRAWTLAHMAEDATPLDTSDLAVLAEAGVDLEMVKLAVMPSVSLLALDWPIFDIWEGLRAEEELAAPIELERHPQYALVWRYQLKVHYRVLDAAEFEFLSAVKAGKALGVAMKAAMTSLPTGAETDLTRLLPNALGAEVLKREPD